MATLQDILTDLASLPDWESRYEYVIDLGRTLPPMDPALKTEATLVKGCTSRVWLVVGQKTPAKYDAELTLTLDSDALIVKGLLGLVYAAYEGQKSAAVPAVKLVEVVGRAGLMQHLSPNRRSGLASVVAHIEAAAARMFG